MLELILSLIIFIKHPLPIGAALILLSLRASVKIALTTNIVWFSIILVIVIVGGVLVLFLYMSVLAANNPSTLSIKLILLAPGIYATTTQDNLETNAITIKHSNRALTMDIAQMIIFLAVYLLVALVVVSSLAKSKAGPLRRTYENSHKNHKKKPG